MPDALPLPPHPEIAFYYPGPFWQSAGWIKSLLLFFDGVSLLVPTYMRDRPEQLEPEMVLPLQEKGLLTLIEPETAVDKVATEQLASALTNVIVSGALDQLAKDSSAFHELSWSRLGGYGDQGLARMIFEELKARGLARDTEDGVSIPMHPLVRSLVLVLLAQILRPYGQTQGWDLSPATDRPQLVGALQELLDLDASPAAGQVVTLDLQAVGVDLAKVPLDDVLAFRKEHHAEYRQYAASVRRFVRDLSLIPAPDRGLEFETRREELRSLAEAINRSSKKTWKRAARFRFGNDRSGVVGRDGQPARCSPRYRRGAPRIRVCKSRDRSL
jgi:hypothetical protein